MKVTNDYPVQPEQLKAAKEILHKYGNTKRCEMCGRIINAGKYCDDCAKQLAGKNYV